MTLPHSSACVERIFSCVNLIKTKYRNRLNTHNLIGLLHMNLITLWICLTNKCMVLKFNMLCFKLDIFIHFIYFYLLKSYSSELTKIVKIYFYVLFSIAYNKKDS